MIICVVPVGPSAESYSSGSLSTRPSLPAVGRLIVQCQPTTIAVCLKLLVCHRHESSVLAGRNESMLRIKLPFLVNSFRLQIGAFLSNDFS